MNALIAEPIAKLIMALLIGLGIYFGIKHYNGLNQKIGRLETVLEEKQDLIDAQNQNFISLKKTSHCTSRSDFELTKGSRRT